MRRLLSEAQTGLFTAVMLLGCSSGTGSNPQSAAAGTSGTGAGGQAGDSGTGGTASGGHSGVGGAARHTTCDRGTSTRLTNATVPAGYCAWTFAEGLDAPRGITTDAAGQLLVVERGGSQVTLLYDDDGDGVSSAQERVVVAQASGLNHGIAINGGRLYASSDTTVYAWDYSGERGLLGAPTTVISGIPGGGNHTTRTLRFDEQGSLFMSVGSASNLDGNFDRARVVKFTAAQLATGTTTWADRIAFADGTRNEVGLRFDASGQLWGVENGSDNLSRADLGGDLHSDNPAEELNLFATAGFYGYPYCWSEGLLPGVGLGPTTQWAYDTGSVHNDVWCQTATNVIPPKLAMQAHSAPLDLLFYSGDSFPSEQVGNLLVTFHGSWNRTPATGYKVVTIPIGANGLPASGPVDLLSAATPGDPASWGHRPVGLTMGARGEVFVTSDATGVVLAIGHDGT
jgi:glucose/arabinose dehydrogenase